MVSTVISPRTDLTLATSRLNAITPIPPSSPTGTTAGENSNTSFLSKFQINLPMAISALATGVEPFGLPDNFELSPFDVVCGRGKGSYNRPGNKLFRTIVYNHVDEYLAAKSKLDKSMVLSCIVDQVREQNNGCTRFVKQRRDNKTWYEIGDDLAREKVGHAIREAICARQHAAAAESKKDDNSNKQADTVVNHQEVLVFHNKQETLLTQQQHIFQEMIHIKQANMMLIKNAQIHTMARNWQEQLQPSPLSALTQRQET